MSGVVRTWPSPGPGGISADPAIALSVTGQGVDEVREAVPSAARLADLGIRVGGATMVVLDLAWAIVTLAGCRRGERWAWLAMWTMPLWMAFVTAVYLAADRVPDAPLPPPPLISGPLLLAISLVLVLLGSRAPLESADGYADQASAKQSDIALGE